MFPNNDAYNISLSIPVGTASILGSYSKIFLANLNRLAYWFEGYLYDNANLYPQKVPDGYLEAVIGT